MVSKCAESAILDLWDQGLKPTVADIIRLNAVGLRSERTMFPTRSLYAARRCAFLGEGEAQVVLREPCLGHEMWIDQLRGIVDLDDLFTSLTVDAFVCGVDLDELPDPTSPKKLKAAIAAFAARCASFSRAQIAAAVLWCKSGTDWMEGEDAAVQKSDDDAADPIDDSFSFAVGIVRNGIAIGVGLTFKEAAALPRHAFQAMVFRRARYDGAVDEKKRNNSLDDDFYRTLDEITARLKGEAANG